MKILLYYITTSLLVLGCGTNGKSKTNDPALGTNEVQQTEDKLLLGPIAKENLMQEPFNEWFVSAYKSYTPEEELVSNIAQTINAFDITVFMGTWCSDSQREIPQLYKILEAADYNMSKLKVIAVDRDKKTPNSLEEGYHIELVPTIIFNKNGKEVNRFVEFAQESLVKDIYKIVSGQPYKHSYAE